MAIPKKIADRLTGVFNSVNHICNLILCYAPKKHLACIISVRYIVQK